MYSTKQIPNPEGNTVYFDLEICFDKGFDI